jgi:hypothetical protein
LLNILLLLLNILLLLLLLLPQNRTRLGFGRDRAFVPTPNVRNPNMLVEAEAFAHHLGGFQKAVKDYHSRVQGEERVAAAVAAAAYLAGCVIRPSPSDAA